MGTQDNGLTLEGLAHKLEGLTHKLESLERENAELRHKVATMEGSGTRRDEGLVSRFDGPVSRRALLTRAGAAALGVVAAGTLLSTREAKATHYNPGIKVNDIETHAITVWGGPMQSLRNDNTNPAGAGSNDGAGPGLEGTNRGSATSGIGVKGASASGTGVKGAGKIGVHGISSTTGHGAVYGQHTGQGYGVVGDGAGPANAGVLGRNPSGSGVRGQSDAAGTGAVVGKNSVVGIGVVGECTQGTGVEGHGRTGVFGTSSATGWGAVWGRHFGQGDGVVGTGKGGSFAGVRGDNPSGYGGFFQGGKAQLKLKPSGSAGKPTTGTHTKGEIYMDSAGTLFVCTAGDGTTVGTWKKVNMKLV